MLGEFFNLSEPDSLSGLNWFARAAVAGSHGPEAYTTEICNLVVWRLEVQGQVVSRCGSFWHLCLWDVFLWPSLLFL